MQQQARMPQICRKAKKEKDKKKKKAKIYFHAQQSVR